MLCSVCFDNSVQRADIKLVQSPVAKAHLSDMVQSVLPEATRNECVAVARSLLKSGIAVERKGRCVHRLWPFLEQLKTDAVLPVDAIGYASSHGALWAVSLLTAERLTEAGLYVFCRKSSSRLQVRQCTHLNAVDKSMLEKAIKVQGVRGTPLEIVYKEYSDAFRDIFLLEGSGCVTIDENLVWHSSNVPRAKRKAFEAWRSALAEYKE